MQLTIIIVNYNGEAFLMDCIQSVQSQFNFFPDFKVIIFDNASTDQSLHILDKLNDHRFQIIKHPKNIGFPQAHNVLLPDLNTPFLWLLNNDTCFNHQQDAISPILNHFKTDPQIVGISPKLLNTDGSLQSQGSGFSSFRFKRNHTTTVPFLSGASLFIRTSFFKKIGGFDPNLYFYNDDVDFALQAKKNGKKLIYFPSVSVTHHGGLSTQSQQMETRVGGYIGSLYLCKKYYPLVVFIIYKWLVTLLIVIQYGHYRYINTKQSHWPDLLKKGLYRIRHEL